MYLFRLAMASLANRRFTAILTAFAIALSVCLLLAVERVRVEARNSFASTISGTDLIVGARSGSVNLLLYSVFRIGNATNNIRWDSYEHFAANPQVKWAIPISLGDSHRGYRVMGTNESYFEHYQYGRKQHLELGPAAAPSPTDPFEVVLGAEVAEALHYKLGDQLVLAHGVAVVSLVKHDDKPFTVVGILKRTGTPGGTAHCISASAAWRRSISTGHKRRAGPGQRPHQCRSGAQHGPDTRRRSPPSCSA